MCVYITLWWESTREWSLVFLTLNNHAQRYRLACALFPFVFLSLNNWAWAFKKKIPRFICNFKKNREANSQINFLCFICPLGFSTFTKYCQSFKSYLSYSGMILVTFCILHSASMWLVCVTIFHDFVHYLCILWFPSLLNIFHFIVILVLLYISCFYIVDSLSNASIFSNECQVYFFQLFNLFLGCFKKRLNELNN